MPTTLALAGAGHITIVHGLAAQAIPNVDITYVASRTRQSAQTRANQVQAKTCTYEELPAGADVVIVATPPARHATDALHALAAGASVIVEKPLATTLGDADAMVQASSDAGGRLGYAENLAFAPIVIAAQSAIKQLGPLRHLEVRSMQGRPDWGDFLRPEWGGGALFDLGVHPIAVALLMAGIQAENGAGGGPSVDAVRARISGAADIEVDDYAEVELILSTGLVARVVASWKSAETQWDLQAASEDGVVRADLLPYLSLEVNGEPVALPEIPQSVEVPQLHQFGYVTQLNDFVDDFAQETEPTIGARFGRFVLEIVCAAYASASNDGQDIPLPFTGPRDKTPLELWRSI